MPLSPIWGLAVHVRMNKLHVNGVSFTKMTTLPMDGFLGGRATKNFQVNKCGLRLLFFSLLDRCRVWIVGRDNRK